MLLFCPGQVLELTGVDRSETVTHTMCDGAKSILNAFESMYPLHSLSAVTHMWRVGESPLFA